MPTDPPRVLLIDNYDSFTYNLHHQLARVTGVAPITVRNDELTLPEIVALDPDAIVISPGPGSPATPSDLGVCAAVLTELTATPVLGVCLGFQALVTAAGGVIERAEPVHGLPAELRHSASGLFLGLPERFDVIRYHSLAARTPLPDDLEATAWTGDGLVMAAAHRARPAWGVQFHPESICTQHGDRMIANFLALAAVHRPPTTPGAAWRRRTEPVARRAAPRPPTAGARCQVRPLAGWHEPEDVFVAIYGDASHAFWLDSSSSAPGSALFSFLGAERTEGTTLSYDVAAGQVTTRRGRSVDRSRRGILDALEEELAGLRVEPVDQVPFVGGFVGYLGYEVAAEFDGRPRNSAPGRRTRAVALPDAYWMLADRVLAFDHEHRRAWAVALSADDSADDAAGWLELIRRQWAGVTPSPPPAAATNRPDPARPITVRLDREPDGYLSDIEACQEAIRAGESYELCLTAQAELEPVSAPLDLYRVLRRVSPAPYAAYLRIGSSAVLSSSPERFLAVGAEGTVTSRPMKGTAPRHPDPVEDARLREQLRTSVKDRAENLMIVDLLRNDLGRVCRLDSVRVPALMTVETYATVHQLTSTITGRLTEGTGVLDCLRAAFPGGSMTGAPKLRSMEILDRLEPGPRGIYSGSLGYLSADGRAELDIVIRTAVCTPEATTIGIGGAITALSDPRAEYDEIILKAQGLLRALCAWQRRTYDPALVVVAGPSAKMEA